MSYYVDDDLIMLALRMVMVVMRKNEIVANMVLTLDQGSRIE